MYRISFPVNMEREVSITLLRINHSAMAMASPIKGRKAKKAMSAPLPCRKMCIRDRKVFSPNEVNMVYSMYDRMVVGGAMPVGEVLQLEAIGDEANAGPAFRRGGSFFLV